MATTNLTKTPATSGNRNQWTWSAWVKRSTTGSASSLFGVYYSSGAYQDNLYFQSSGKLDWFIWNNNTYTGRITTDRLFRDVSAWYHLVCVYDNTLATATDRMKLYVNGVRETSLSNVTNPVQNSTLSNVNTTNPFILGNDGNGNNHFDGSMTHVHFIDGTAYDASYFGETDTATGIWKPKTAPVVTYGTNGFFLKFENSASLGTDSSVNTNNFTVNGTPTQTVDTPSNVFATLNPLYKFDNFSLTNGNNTFTNTATNWTSGFSTLGASQGKYYVEAKQTAGTYGVFGVINSQNIYQIGGLNDSLGNVSIGNPVAVYYGNSGQKRVNGTDSSFGDTFTNGDIVGMAVDFTNSKIYWSKNGTWQGSGDPTAGTGGVTITGDTDYVMAVGCYSSSAMQTNFGNGYFGTTAVASAQNPDDGIGIFEYDVPTGYRALCTKSINAQEYS
jgi:hypothetical protein